MPQHLKNEQKVILCSFLVILLHNNRLSEVSQNTKKRCFKGFLNYVNPPTCWWTETRGRRTSPAPGSGWPGSAGHSLKVAIGWLLSCLLSSTLVTRYLLKLFIFSPDTSSSRRLGQLSSITARWLSSKLSLKNIGWYSQRIRLGLCRDSYKVDIVLTYSTLDLLLTKC